MILLGIIVLLAIIIVICGAYIVQQQTMVIIERLGKFHTVTGPGFHVKIPLVDRIARRVDMKTNQSEFVISGKTKDNVTLRVRVAVQFCVQSSPEGVQASYYSLADPVAQMNSYIIDALRSAIPGYDLDAVFEEKDAIAQLVQSQVTNEMLAYGYVIQNTLITDINLPPDVEASMNRINSAKREQEAAQALAEAERIKVVTEARAQAEAMEQSGRGIAAQRKAIADGIADSLESIKASGVSTAEANTLFLFTQWTDMMERFAKSGRATTVVLPSDFRESASMFEQLLASDAVEDNAPSAAKVAAPRPAAPSTAGMPHGQSCNAPVWAPPQKQ